MSPSDVGDRHPRPGAPTATNKTNAATKQLDHRQSTAAQLRRRRDAALRCPPLDWRVARCGRSGLAARDPLVPAQRAEGPSTYGLLPHELWAEVRRLRRAGWPVDEVRQVLAVTPGSGMSAMAAEARRLHDVEGCEPYAGAYHLGITEECARELLAEDEPAGLAPTGPADGAAVLVRLSTVTPERLTWLWEGRLPRGKV